ncbi:hypothetical protein QBZ16_002310 [Prototheca wickerhamii]|uniref:Uncharacterized protein n=1 Tax=Prototheca wickerhamii TaxID=3111 RepID=A0AAD9IM92_PROWI|nr:hypothetical protein QBZ16_002310 [Prototheca wickerhamii]
MVKWMSFRGEWCHRACFEQFRQEHDKFVKEKEFYGKLKGRLFPRVSHAPSLATIESDVSYRNIDNVVLTRSLAINGLSPGRAVGAFASPRPSTLGGYVG